MYPVLHDGAWPILLTPFTTDNTLDLAALDELLAFYAKVHVSGLLALGQASEVLKLSNAERFAIAERVALRCQGRLPAVAVGNYGATLEDQAAALARIGALGVDAAVVAPSLLPSAQDLGGQLLRLAELTDPALPLAVYELPEPEHRLLSADEVGAIARTGRFVFMKDTCRQVEPFTAKVAAARGTPLKVFQANMKILPPSLDVGAAGFCGWMAMVAPELVAQVCDLAGTPADVRAQAHDKLMAFQTAMVAQGFPASAKHILQRRGLSLTTRCRVMPPERFGPANAATMDAFLAEGDWFAPIPA